MSAHQTLKSVIVVNDHAYINGGQAKVAIQSAILLAGEDLNVSFFAACGPVDPSLEKAGIDVVCLEQPDSLSNPNRLNAAMSGIWNGTAAKALKAHLSGFDPDSTVVHCHGFAKALSPSIGPVLTQGPMASVYTMHEYFMACPNGGFYDYKDNEICTRKPLSLSCAAKNCDARHYAHKIWRLARNTALVTRGDLPKGLSDIIYISDTQLGAMQAYLSKDTRLHSVSNPVDFHDGDRVHAEDNDVFLFVGRLNKEKGGSLFAKAAKQAGVKAVFVGDGPEKDDILAVNPEAIITGWVEPDQVKAWLAKARCLVFPSLWYECQPLVPLEALCQGVPVISGAWTAAREAIVHGETGEIVETRTVGDWSKAIKSVDENVLDLSQNAYSAFAKRMASAPTHQSELVALYEEILLRRSA